MMRVELVRHPSTSADAVRRIDVQVERTATGLSLCYGVEGDIERMRIPAQETAARRDELWRHTCFEAFVAAASGSGYRELNFSPSGEWAAYAFSGYRDGMRAVDVARAPRVSVLREPGRLVLEAIVDAELLARSPGGAELRVALAAVIEAADGAVSYWALAHPPGKPDFHHAVGFALAVG